VQRSSGPGGARAGVRREGDGSHAKKQERVGSVDFLEATGSGSSRNMLFF
jgi:hypothetical protein